MNKNQLRKQAVKGYKRYLRMVNEIGFRPKVSEKKLKFVRKQIAMTLKKVTS